MVGNLAPRRQHMRPLMMGASPAGRTLRPAIACVVVIVVVGIRNGFWWEWHGITAGRAHFLVYHLCYMPSYIWSTPTSSNVSMVQRQIPNLCHSNGSGCESFQPTGLTAYLQAVRYDGYVPPRVGDEGTYRMVQ